MADRVLIQIWHDKKFYDEVEFERESDDYGGGLGFSDVILTFQEALMALDSGEQFTLVANRL